MKLTPRLNSPFSGFWTSLPCHFGFGHKPTAFNTASPQKILFVLKVTPKVSAYYFVQGKIRSTLCINHRLSYN